MPSIMQNEDPLRRWRLLATAVFILFLSACSLTGTAEKERLAQLQLHSSAGEAAWRARDYVAAQDAYTQAQRFAPTDGQIAFRLGYLGEALGNYAAAAGVYREALKIPALPAELRHDLTYRLALLEAFRLQGETQVPRLLATLPPTSAYAADLQAVLALLAGDGRQALAALNQALTLPLSQELSSIILYHAARAYYLTGESDRALQSLFEAINRAGYAPVSKDIAEFRELLRTQPRH